jgi:hypothetical protein
MERDVCVRWRGRVLPGDGGGWAGFIEEAEGPAGGISCTSGVTSGRQLAAAAKSAKR